MREGGTIRGRIRPSCLVAFALVLPAGCATVPSVPFTSGPSDLLEEAGAALDAPPMDQVQWGVMVARVEEDEEADARDGPNITVVGERNAHRRFIPASNLKLPVTAAALSVLGPEFRYETSLYATGPRDGRFLRGDLVLPGVGDPTLGAPFHEDGHRALEALADSVAASGIRVVEGALVVDASAWDSTAVPPSWTVGSRGRTYGASGGAFAVDSGELRLEARGAREPGEEASVEWRPMGEADFVDAQITTVGEEAAEGISGLRAAYRPETRRMEVRGTVASGEVDTLRVAIQDPVRQASALLHRLLRDRGVEAHFGLHILWDQGEQVGRGCLSGSIPECNEAWKVAGLESPPLSEVVEVALSRSQNWTTEQLVRTLGYEVHGRGSWGEGLRVVSDFLVDEVGVAPGDFVLRDGSGLSTHNLLTPRAVVRLLAHMQASEVGPTFRNTLPSPGEGSSTLESRLEGLEGRLNAKTGTLTHVNALSGYLTRSDGSQLIFSIMANASGLPAPEVRTVMDALVRSLSGEED